MGTWAILRGRRRACSRKRTLPRLPSILEPDAAGLLLMFENLWAVPFAVAARKAGGQLVAHGRIPVQALLAQLDALEA